MHARAGPADAAGMLCALAGDGGCFYGTLSKGLGGGDQPQDVIEGADVIFPAVGF